MTVTVTKGIIKMPDEGDALTMHVVKCEVVEGKFGEQVKFTGANGDALFIGRDTADRQLGRQGFADGELVIYGDVDGTTLAFARDPNPKMPAKPYWSISRAASDAPVRSTGNAKAPESLGPHVPGLDEPRPSLVERAKAEAEKVRQAKGLPINDDTPRTADDLLLAIDAAYAHGYAVARDVQGKTATPDSLQAGAATLLISYGQNKLIASFAPPRAVEAPAPPKPPVKPPTKLAPPPTDPDDPGPDEAFDETLPF